MNKHRTTLRVVALLLAACAIAGCTKGTSDLRDWVAKEKARKGAPLRPLPVIKTFETFTYHDQSGRDPFEPSPAESRETAHANSGPRPDENRPREPLESFALDSLKMVGTIGKQGKGHALIALIRDPTGVIHSVHVNDYMGQNYGHVTDIGEDHIDLSELVSNGNGGWMERHARIALEQ